MLAHNKGLPASGMVAKLGAGAEMKDILGFARNTLGCKGLILTMKAAPRVQ